MEQVLNLRESREEKAALEQARAMEEYRINYENLCSAREILARAEKTDVTADPFDLFNKLAYCEAMAGEVKNHELILKSTSEKLEQCRRKLMKAMQDRSVMEKLKLKEHRNYQHIMAVREQKENDEMAARQYIFNKVK